VEWGWASHKDEQLCDLPHVKYYPSVHLPCNPSPDPVPWFRQGSIVKCLHILGVGQAGDIPPAGWLGCYMFLPFISQAVALRT
jgi:hypothetical protein